ncbi:glycosyltransferase family 4 protein [Clostridium hominis]|nr:glycosyltransferase family 4 protein [Clostridium hominis]
MIGQKGIPSRAGGVEVHVEEIAAGLCEKDVQVDVYARKSYCDEINDKYRGINIKYIPSINTKSLDAITYTFLATIYALFLGYDVIHYHALGPSSMAWLPRLFGIKVVCTVHGLDWQREKWGVFGKLYLKFGEFIIAKFANEIIVLTNSMKKHFKEKWNRDSTVISNGVYIEKNIAADIITDKYQLTKDSYILFLARLVPEKGAHYLINAYKKLKTDKKLVIVGGSSYTNDYVNSLYKLAGSDNNIIFTGFVKGKELEELYSNAYVYVLPSEIEGLPISLLEALSYGNCCIASDIDEICETMKEYGLYFKKGSDEMLSKVLYEILDNKGLVARYKDSSKGFVLSEYNWKDKVVDTLEVYNKCVNIDKKNSKIECHKIFDSRALGTLFKIILY